MTSHFIISALDREGCLELRMRVRPDHAAYVRANTPAMVKIAGPYLNQQGDMVGSMFIVTAGSQEEAERFIAQDPYAKAGLFAEVRVRPWELVIGKLED